MVEQIMDVLVTYGSGAVGAIVEILIGAAVVYLINVVRKHNLESKVLDLVEAAEEVYKESGMGEKKTEWVYEMVEKLGLKISKDNVDVLIKKGCAKLNEAKIEVVEALEETVEPLDFRLTDAQIDIIVDKIVELIAKK